MSRTVKKRKRKIFPRLPMEAVEALKHKGGAHSSPKGKKGYDRKKLKHQTKREDGE